MSNSFSCCMVMFLFVHSKSRLPVAPAGRAIFTGLPGSGFRRFKLLESRRSYHLPITPLIPRAGGIGFAPVACPGRVIKILIDQSCRRRNASDRKGRFAHT